MLGSIIAVTDVLDIGEGAYSRETERSITMSLSRDYLQTRAPGDTRRQSRRNCGIWCLRGLGPLDGLLHVSQIADDYISFDEKNSRLVGKRPEGHYGRRYAAGSSVAVSLNEREPRESKIGLTMRQAALGKVEWLAEAREKAKKEEEEQNAGTSV